MKGKRQKENYFKKRFEGNNEKIIFNTYNNIKTIKKVKPKKK